MLLAERHAAKTIPDHCSHNCDSSIRGRSRSRGDSHSDVPEAVELPRAAVIAPAKLPSRVTSSSRDLAPSRTFSRSGHNAVYEDELQHGLGILHVTDSHPDGTGKRAEVRRMLSNIAHQLGTAAPDRHDDHDFRSGKATGFPVVPGEESRNPDLVRIREQWGHTDADDDGVITPRGRRSRAGSFNGSVSGAAGVTRSLSATRRAQSPPHSGKALRAASSTLLALPASSPGGSHELTPSPIVATPPSPEASRPKPLTRVVTLHSGQHSPSIVVSSEAEANDPSDSEPASPLVSISDPP
jgi:hypothetical protein